MRDLVTLLLFVAALAVFAGGNGPMFFGAPLIGLVLVGAGIVLEVVAWWRLTHRGSGAHSPSSR